jgi:pyruvate dehydrogenase E2 component (dihydrolipoamide acetyltransferase)
MATKVHMEALSPTMEEGQLIRWLKQEGDQIAEGDVLAEIETDKATMELVARGSGVLRGVKLKEGETAPVGTVIATIAGEGEEADDAEAEGAEAEGAEEPEAEEPEEAAPEVEKGDAKPAPAEAEERAAAKVEEVPTQRQSAGGRVKASPLARRLASEAGVELDQVDGSGPGGRITRRDIEAAVKAGGAAQRQAGAAQQAAPAARFEGPDVEEVPVSQMRKAIARRLATSIGPVPTFYLTIDVDMARVLDAREAINDRLEKQGVKASVNDFIIKATAAALARHPEINAAWGETVVYRHRRVHIGVAVAIEDGLITPIVRDADRKGIAEIAQEVRELAGRAREKKLKPEEFTGATFSISNLGMFGIDEFTAIINPPEAAILAVGQVEERVFVEDGDVVVGPRMKITMSCDHRVIDGAMGAKFLQTLQGFLEEPMMMMV